MPRVLCLVIVLMGCDTVVLGADPFDDASDAIAMDDAAPRDAGSAARGRLDADFFFCRVQPEALAPSHCASRSGCHATRTNLRLLAGAETDAPPTCVDDHPTSAVPSSYYTNLTRARSATRGTARTSDLYWRPLGHGHPETIFDASSTEARVIAAWIEGTAP